MERFGRIVLVGIAAGLLLSIWGTLSRVVLSPLAGDAAALFKEQDFQLVLLGFFLDLALGFFYVVAYAIIRRRGPAAFWKRFLLFWVILLTVGVLPRAVEAYRMLAVPDRLTLAWGIVWTAEALTLALVIALLFPKGRPREGATEPARAPEERG